MDEIRFWLEVGMFGLAVLGILVHAIRQSYKVDLMQESLEAHREETRSEIKAVRDALQAYLMAQAQATERLIHVIGTNDKLEQRMTVMETRIHASP